jgi:hypothetical protein
MATGEVRAENKNLHGFARSAACFACSVDNFVTSAVVSST